MAELLERMTSYEFTEWQEHLSLERKEFNDYMKTLRQSAS